MSAWIVLPAGLPVVVTRTGGVGPAAAVGPAARSPGTVTDAAAWSMGAGDAGAARVVTVPAATADRDAGDVDPARASTSIRARAAEVPSLRR